MNSLTTNGKLTEMECGANFAVILKDNAFFLPTEYKVLQNQKDGCFVKCMRMLYNGKTELYYFAGELKSLSSLLSTIDAERFLTVLCNLLGAIINVQSNGFLTCRNIDASFERIYIDPNTYKVNLVYLPLKENLFDDDTAFENEIRTSLVKRVRTFWAVVFILLPIALIFSENSMHSLQSVSIIAAFPIGIIILIIVASFFRDASGYLQERKDTQA